MCVGVLGNNIGVCNLGSTEYYIGRADNMPSPGKRWLTSAIFLQRALQMVMLSFGGPGVRERVAYAAAHVLFWGHIMHDMTRILKPRGEGGGPTKITLSTPANEPCRRHRTGTSSGGGEGATSRKYVAHRNSVGRRGKHCVRAYRLPKKTRRHHMHL